MQCDQVSRGSGTRLLLDTSSAGGELGAPKHRAPIDTGFGGRADFCRLALPLRNHQERVVTTVALTAVGYDYVDQQRVAQDIITLAFLPPRLVAKYEQGALTAVGGVTLPGEGAAPPAGKLGFYSSGTHRYIAKRDRAGLLLFFQQDRDVTRQPTCSACSRIRPRLARTHRASSRVRPNPLGPAARPNGLMVSRQDRGGPRLARATPRAWTDRSSASPITERTNRDQPPQRRGAPRTALSYAFADSIAPPPALSSLARQLQTRHVYRLDLVGGEVGSRGRACRWGDRGVRGGNAPDGSVAITAER